MGLPTPDMDDCCKKQKCLVGPNAGQVYSTCDPCRDTGEFNEKTCDCEGEGECWGGRYTYTSCSNTNPTTTCGINAGVRCEEDLGGCPSFVEFVVDPSIYNCDLPTGAFTLGIVWQYPDGSLHTVVIASGSATKIQNASITVLSRVTCGTYPCPED